MSKVELIQFRLSPRRPRDMAIREWLERYEGNRSEFIKLVLYRAICNGFDITKAQPDNSKQVMPAP